MAKLKICEKCNHAVEWKQSKVGKWYLVTQRDRKGHYSTIPHYMECEAIKENMEIREQYFGAVGL